MFIHSCITGFLYDIITLEPIEILLAFLVGKFCWRLILSAFVSLIIALCSHHFCMVYLVNMTVDFFFSTLKMLFYCILTSIVWQEVSLHSYHCFPVFMEFLFFFLSLANFMLFLSFLISLICLGMNFVLP